MMMMVVKTGKQLLCPGLLPWILAWLSNKVEMMLMVMILVMVMVILDSPTRGGNGLI